ncbi:MAG: DUF2490 domain-containing protein [Cyclobacteriaceae bacterium]
MKRNLLLLTLFIASSTLSVAQPNEDRQGAWYMYFWNTSIGESGWGFQGDIQHRNWNVIGDLEQLLLRGGITYSPKDAGVKFTFGYGNIQTGAYGDDNSTTSESRIYQEALFPQKLGGRFYLNHRIRYEQRFVENQDFRTRYRYNLFVNIPLNNPSISDGTVYLALYNELFINAQRDIGDGRSVEIFDRNRFYTAVGYAFKKSLRVQLGTMRQSTNGWTKNQLQFSLHHTI